MVKRSVWRRAGWLTAVLLVGGQGVPRKLEVPDGDVRRIVRDRPLIDGMLAQERERVRHGAAPPSPPCTTLLHAEASIFFFAQ